MLEYVYKDLENRIYNFVTLKYLIEIKMNEKKVLPLLTLITHRTEYLRTCYSKTEELAPVDLPIKNTDSLGDFILFISFSNLPSFYFRLNCISLKEDTISIKGAHISLVSKSPEEKKENISDTLLFHCDEPKLRNLSIINILASVFRSQLNYELRFFNSLLTEEYHIERKIKNVIIINDGMPKDYIIKSYLSKEAQVEILEMLVKKMESSCNEDQSSVYDYIHDGSRIGLNNQMADRGLLRVKVVSTRKEFPLYINSALKIKVVYPFLKKKIEDRIEKFTKKKKDDKKYWFDRQITSADTWHTAHTASMDPVDRRSLTEQMIDSIGRINRLERERQNRMNGPAEPEMTNAFDINVISNYLSDIDLDPDINPEEPTSENI